jgi:death on curing protein
VDEPVWLTADLVLAIHARQMRVFGGAIGLRDRSALESALGRPRNPWAYGSTDLAGLAAAYAFGIARNHPFVDGNKRVSLLALVTFLGLNGVDFIAEEAESAVIIRDLAAGQVEEAGLARWIRESWPRADGS